MYAGESVRDYFVEVNAKMFPWQLLMLSFIATLLCALTDECCKVIILTTKLFWSQNSKNGITKNRFECGTSWCLVS